MFTLDPMIVSIILGPTVVPIISALLLKANASSRVKIILNAVISVIITFVAGAVVAETGAAVFSFNQLAQAFVVFITSSVGYDNFWKPVINLPDLTAPTKGLG